MGYVVLLSVLKLEAWLANDAKNVLVPGREILMMLCWLRNVKMDGKKVM